MVGPNACRLPQLGMHVNWCHAVTERPNPDLSRPRDHELEPTWYFGVMETSVKALLLNILDRLRRTCALELTCNVRVDRGVDGEG